MSNDPPSTSADCSSMCWSASAALTLSVLGLDEVAEAFPSGVTHAVSLVDPGQPLPATLEAVPEHRRLVVYVHDALDASDGRKPPAYSDALALARFATSVDLRTPVHLLVHCHMGRSRSAAAAAILLLRMGVGSPAQVLQCVRAVRDPIWPNATLLDHGDQLLNLRGALLKAGEDVYREVTQRFPRWVDDPRPENVLPDSRVRGNALMKAHG